MSNYNKILKREPFIVFHYSFNFLCTIVLLSILSMRDIENSILYLSLHFGIFISYGIVSGFLLMKKADIFWKKSFIIIFLSTIFSILLSIFIFLDSDLIRIHGYWGAIMINMNDFIVPCFFVVWLPFLSGYGVGAILGFTRYLLSRT